jgi:intein/homing endonuclease
MLGVLGENLLVLLSFDEERSPIIRNAIDINLFGGQNKVVAARVYDYIDKYKKPPKDHLADILDDKINSANKREAELYADIVSSIHDAKGTINAEYVMTQLGTFARRQSLRTIAIDLSKALQRDTEASLEEADQLIRKAQTKSLDLFDPGIRLGDKKRALNFLDIQSTSFPTGIAELDRRGFGPTRKELWMLVANTKKGKCIAAGELVALADGSYLPIEKIPLVSAVPSATAAGDFIFSKSTLSSNGKKKVYLLTTRTNRSIRATANHKLLTPGGWKELRSIKPGDYVAAPFNLPLFGCETMDERAARFVGYMIADGGMSKEHTPTFTKNDPAIVEDFAACVRFFACVTKEARTAPGHFYVVSDKGKNNAAEFLRTNNLMKKKSNVKEIPQNILKLKKEILIQFLRALLSCDGSVLKGKTGGHFEYSTTSHILAKQVDHLFTRFGIVCKIRERWQKVSGRDYCSWTLIVAGQRQLALLQDEIGLLSIKGIRLEALVEAFKNNKPRGNYNSNKRLGALFYDKVKSIKADGEALTYDLSVEENHNFVAGNILVHNSWSLMHLAKMALMHRLKVLHITLEMSDDRTAQRYYQGFFSISKRKETYRTTKFVKDSLGRISGFEEAILTPALTFEDPNIRAKLERRIDKWGPRLLDNIYVKQFPTGALTVNQLVAYMDNLETTERFVPDLLILDYPDLMRLDKANYRLSLDELYKDIRGILVERNIAGAVVSQSHREAARAKTVRADNVSEAYSKVAHTDVTITMSQTSAEQQLGLARLHVAAGRNDADNLTVVISQNYGTGNFVVGSCVMRGNYFGLLPQAEDGEAE